MISLWGNDFMKTINEQTRIRTIQCGERCYFPELTEDTPLSVLRGLSNKLRLPVAFVVDARQCWLADDPNPFYSVDDIWVSEQHEPQHFIGLCKAIIEVPMGCPSFVIL